MDVIYDDNIGFVGIGFSWWKDMTIELFTKIAKTIPGDGSNWLSIMEDGGLVLEAITLDEIMNICDRQPNLTP